MFCANRKFFALLVSFSLIADAGVAQGTLKNSWTHTHWSTASLLCSRQALSGRSLIDLAFRRTNSHLRLLGVQLSQQLSTVSIVPRLENRYPWVYEHRENLVLAIVAAFAAIRWAMGTAGYSVADDSGMRWAAGGAAVGIGALLCRQPKRRAFQKLTAQLEGILMQAQSELPEVASSVETVEKAVDRFSVNELISAGELEDYRRVIRDALPESAPAAEGSQGIPSIYFVQPPDGGRVFYGDGKISLVHYDREKNAIFIPVPVIEDVVLELEEDPRTFLPVLARHAWMHLVRPDSHGEKHWRCRPDPVEQRLLERARTQDDELFSPLSDKDKKDILDITAGVTLHARRVPRWLRYTALKREGRRASREWIQARVLETTRRWAARVGGERPENATKAYSMGWELRLVFYPYSKSRDAFNSPIRWGFNWIHPPTRTRIEMGSTDVVSLGYLTSAQVNEWKARYKTPVQQANAQEPYIFTVLSLVGQPSILRALLSEPEFDAVEHARTRAALMGLARLATEAHYRSSVAIMRQRVIYTGYPGGSVRISRDVIDETILVLRRLADRGLDLGGRKTIPTWTQIISARAALAQADMKNGHRGGWERLAPLWFKNVRELAAYCVRTVSYGRAFGLIADDDRRLGKPLSEIKQVVEIGSGGVGLLAMERIQRALAGQGVRLDDMHFYFVDVAHRMLSVGRAALAGKKTLAGRPFHASHIQATAARDLPFRSGSVDLIATGLMASLGEGAKDPRINMLLEMNRVLSDGGYMKLLTRNKVSKDVRRALSRFGFTIITEPNARLTFKRLTLARMAKGNESRMDRFRTRLYGSSYLLAVKTRSLGDAEIASLLADEELQGALRGFGNEDNPPAASSKNRFRHQPRDESLVSIEYNSVGKSDLAPTGISRLQLAIDEASEKEKNADFRTLEECLTCLLWGKEFLRKRERRWLAEFVSLWDDSEEQYLPRRDIHRARMLVNRAAQIPRPALRPPDPVDRRSKRDKLVSPAPDTPGSVAAAPSGPTIWDEFVSEVQRDPALIERIRPRGHDLSELQAIEPLSQEPIESPSESVLPEQDVLPAAAFVVPLPAAPVVEGIPLAPEVTDAAMPEVVGPIVEAMPENRSPYERALERIGEKNGNIGARTRLTPALIDDLISVIRAEPRDIHRHRRIQEILDRSPRITRISAKHICDILKDVGLLDEVVVPSDPGKVSPSSPIVGSPVKKSSPTQPDASAVSGRAEASLEPVLVRLIEFIQGVLGGDSAMAISEKWPGMVRELEAAGIDVPEAVHEKAARYLVTIGPTGSPSAIYWRTASLLRWIGEINESILQVHGKWVLLDWAAEMPRVLLAGVREVRGEQVTMLLPEERVQSEGEVRILPEERLVSRMYVPASGFPERLQAQGYYWSESRAAFISEDMNKLGRREQSQRLSEIDRMRRAATPEVTLPAISKLIAFAERTFAKADQKKEPRYVLESYRRASAVRRIFLELGLRLAAAGVQPHASQKTILTSLAAVDYAAQGPLFYLDPDGSLALLLADLGIDPRDLPMQLLQALATLDQLVTYPNSLALYDILCSLVENRNIQWSETILIVMFMLAKYLHLGDEFYFKKMLADQRLDPRLARVILAFILSRPLEAMQKVARDLWSENVRVRILRDGPNRYRVETSKAAETEHLHSAWVSRMMKQLGNTLQTGRVDLANYQPILDYLRSCAIEVASLQGALEKAADDTADRDLWWARMTHVIRLFNDLYFEPRGGLVAAFRRISGVAADLVFTPGFDKPLRIRLKGLLEGDFPEQVDPSELGNTGFQSAIEYHPSVGVYSASLPARKHAVSVMNSVLKGLSGKSSNDPAARRLQSWVVRVFKTTALFQKQFPEAYLRYWRLKEVLWGAVNETARNQRDSEPFYRSVGKFIDKYSRHPASEIHAFYEPTVPTETAQFEIYGKYCALLNVVANHADPAAALFPFFVDLIQEGQRPAQMTAGPDSNLLTYRHLIYDILQMCRSTPLDLKALSRKRVMRMPPSDPAWAEISDFLIQLPPETLGEVIRLIQADHFTIKFFADLDKREVEAVTSESADVREKRALDAVEELVKHLYSPTDLNNLSLDWENSRTLLEAAGYTVPESLTTEWARLLSREYLRTKTLRQTALAASHWVNRLNVDVLAPKQQWVITPESRIVTVKELPQEAIHLELPEEQIELVNGDAILLPSQFVPVRMFLAPSISGGDIESPLSRVLARELSAVATSKLYHVHAALDGLRDAAIRPGLKERFKILREELLPDPSNPQKQHRYMMDTVRREYAIRQSFVALGVRRDQAAGHLPISERVWKTSDNARWEAFLDHYFDAHGILARELSRLPVDLKPTAEDLLDLYVFLHELADGTVNATLIEVLSAVYDRGKTGELSTGFRLFLFLAVQYYDPALRLSLDGMLKGSTFDQAIVDKFSTLFLSSDKTYVPIVASDILDENFRARVEDAGNRGARIVISKRPSPVHFHTGMAVQVSSILRRAIKIGYAEPGVFEPVIAELQSRGIDPAPLRGIVDAVSSPNPAAYPRQRRTLQRQMTRYLNDVLFGVMRRPFQLSVSSEGENKPVWLYEAHAQSPIRISGLVQGTIPLYRLNKVFTGLEPTKNGFGFQPTIGFWAYRPVDLERARNRMEAVRMLKKTRAQSANLRRYEMWREKAYSAKSLTVDEYSDLLTQLLRLHYSAFTFFQSWYESHSDIQSMPDDQEESSDLWQIEAIRVFVREFSGQSADQISALYGISDGARAHAQYFAHLNTVSNSVPHSRPIAEWFMGRELALATKINDFTFQPHARRLLIHFLEKMPRPQGLAPDRDLNDLMTLPMEDPIWDVISDALLQVPDEQYREIAEKLRARYFKVGLKISLEDYSIEAEMLSAPEAGGVVELSAMGSPDAWLNWGRHNKGFVGMLAAATMSFLAPPYGPAVSAVLLALTAVHNLWLLVTPFRKRRAGPIESRPPSALVQSAG